LIDGDQVLAMCAKDMREKGTLKRQTVVATVMSNLGLELAIGELGITLLRAEVGDRYVVEQMLAGGYNLGGEQSGHIVFLDHNTTGDGAITCLQLLALLMEKGKRLSELKKVMTRLPQVLINVRVKEKKDMSAIPGVQRAMAMVQNELKGRGRILVRYSGTESLARVMIEGENEDKIKQMAGEIADAIGQEIGA
jgi:phosphoglucosamine mutase